MTTSAVASPYSDPRAYALRDRYAQLFGGPEIPVPVESIAEDLLGLKLEERLLDWSGMLLPAERTIVLNAAESVQNELPLRRHRFTISCAIVKRWRRSGGSSRGLSPALRTIVRSAGSSIPDQSSIRSSIFRPRRSSAIDSTGTGISGPPNVRAYRSRSACARGSL